MFSIQTNKGPPLAHAAEGSIHMQINIDFHSARRSAEHEYGSSIDIIYNNQTRLFCP